VPAVASRRSAAVPEVEATVTDASAAGRASTAKAVIGTEEGGVDDEALAIVDAWSALKTVPLLGDRFRRPEARGQQPHDASKQATYERTPRAVAGKGANHGVKPAIVHRGPPVAMS